MTKQRAGQLGGLTTALRSTHEQRMERGKLGGRPRSPTLVSLRQQRVLCKHHIKCKQHINQEERLQSGGFSLKKLRELYKLRNQIAGEAI